jgi:biotin carboxylase
MARWLMVLGAGPYQVPVIRKAQQMRFSVLAVDGDPAAPGLRIADAGGVVDVRDTGRCLQMATERRIVGVTTVAVEPAVRTLAAIATALRLPGPSVEAAAGATDKTSMRAAWSRAGVPSTRSFPCTTREALFDAVDALGFPVVVKPADSAGSRGVERVDRAGRLVAAYEAALAASRRGVAVVEAFMPGVEMSVEAFVCGGVLTAVALSDKRRTAPPYLLDTMVSFPSEQPAQVQERAIEIVRRAVRALGLDMCTVHAEVMVTPQGPRMVELAARGAGFKVFTHMVPWSSGTDAVAALIRLAVGATVSVRPCRRRGAVLWFPQAVPGWVRAIRGLEEARATPGIHEIGLFVQAGDTVRPLTCGTDRIGYVIALARSRRTAEAAVHRAGSCLVVETRPPEAAVAGPRS